MKITKILNWFTIFIVFCLMISSVFFTPLIEWNWGYYNIEILATLGVLLFYLIFSISYKLNRVLDKLDKILEEK